MAVDMFLRIEGIDGESVDDAHENEIDILSWSLGAAQSGTTHVGRGGGAGKVQVQDLTVTKWIDKASPVLLKHCCLGKHIKQCVLVVRKASGDSPLEYIKFTLEDCLVSALTPGGTEGDDRLMESLTINFGRFKYDYVPQKDDGSGDAAISMGYNIAENKEW